MIDKNQGQKMTGSSQAKAGWEGHVLRERKAMAWVAAALAGLALCAAGAWTTWGEAPKSASAPAAQAPADPAQAELAKRVPPKPREAGQVGENARLEKPSAPATLGVKIAPLPAPKAPRMAIDPTAKPPKELLARGKDGSLALAVDERGLATLPDGTVVQTRPVGRTEQAKASGRLKALEEMSRLQKQSLESSKNGPKLDGNGNPMPLTAQELMARQQR